VLLVCADAEFWKELRSIKELFTNPRSRLTVRVERCEYCGHLQLFNFKDGNPPDAWMVSGSTTTS
jgi:hypothetical protein